MRDQVQARVALLAERLGKLDEARKELLHQLSGVDTKFVATNTERLALLNSLTPIYSLPHEILAAVFRLGCRIQPGFEALASHVTRRWREVALGTPVLWTRIHRVRYAEDLEGLEKPIAYLLRSQSVPIQLVIEVSDGNSRNSRLYPRCCPDPLHCVEHGARHDDDDDDDEYKDDDTNTFRKIIEPHLHRCNQLSLRADHEFGAYEMLDFLFSRPLPMLLSVRVHVGRLELAEIEESHFNFGNVKLDVRRLFRPQVSLTHAHLTGKPQLYWRLPLHNVTTLHLELPGVWQDPGWDELDWYLLTRSLTQAPLLTHLSLDHALHWPPTSVLTLPALRRLSCPVRDFPADDISGFLLALDAPSLEEMRLGVEREVDDRLASCGPSKFPNLVKLSWIIGEQESTSMASLRKLSEAFPFLVEITYIGRIRQLRQIFVSIQELHDDIDAKIWPRLETVGVETLHIRRTNLPEADLQALFVRRSQMGCPIRTLLLPKDDIVAMQGTDFSSCTQPSVIIAELVGDVSPFLDI